MKPKTNPSLGSGAKANPPTGSGPNLSGCPQGIEILLRRAASDSKFREQLLEQPTNAAAAIGLKLDPAEIAMLECIPREQLLLTIERMEAARGRRRGFLVKLAIATFVAVAVAGEAWLWRWRELSYQGKSLSEWLRLGDQFGWNYTRFFVVAGTLPNWTKTGPPVIRIPQKQEMTEVEEAIRAMGPKAIPSMVTMLETRDHAWKLKLMKWLGKQSVVKVQFTTAESYQKRALIGLTILGPLATNAVPAIQKAMANPANTNHWEFQAFGREALEKITGQPPANGE
jgi:hypothetical protein